MKKLLFVLFVLIGALSAFADSFTDAIQDLAMQTACIGTYSATQAGGGWYDDPHDYYTPQMMAERFTKMSGNMTRTTTFYGVCFDYAQFAWEDIVNYKSWYNEQGMYEGQFWLASVQGNPNEIELMSIAKQGETYTRKQNGVPIKTYPSSIRHVKTHDGATRHAWLWMLRADGVWFWIDPTWTDNLGYVVYGYVENKNGEEIQCRPDKKFCVKYPEHLNSLPLPPPMGARKAPSQSTNSTDRNETIKDVGTNWIVDVFFDVNYNFNKDFIAFLASINIPFSSFTDKSLGVNKMAFSLDMPILTDYFASIIGFEYLRNIVDDHNLHGGLFNFDFTRRFTSFLSWYVGVGAGLRFDSLKKENYYEPDNDISLLAGTGWFAFRINTGFLLNISRIFTKIDVSYDNVIGFSVGAGIGFGL